MGVSEVSEPLALICAWLPTAPQYVKISNLGSFDISVFWAKAMPKGTPITNAKLFIKTQENEFQEVTESCEWSDCVQYCTLSQRVLYYEPFFKTEAKEEVCVKVSVVNMYGESELSDEFCGIVEI